MPLSLQSMAEVVVEHRIGGIDLNRFAETSDRFVELALRLCHGTQIAMEHRRVRIGMECQIDEITREFMVSHLVGQHAEQMQGIGMFGIFAQRFLISRIGLIQPPGLMMRQSDLDEPVCLLVTHYGLLATFSVVRMLFSSERMEPPLR